MISLYDILDSANGQLFGEPGAQIFSDFCFDSRLAADSTLFVALRTDMGDGHQYIQEAVERGATGVLCTRPPDFDTHGLSVILVKDTQIALMSWSHYVMGKMGVQVIGVAGTSARFVAVRAISAVLGSRYKVQESVGDTSGQIGRLTIPLTLAKLTPEHHFIVLDLGTTEIGEMADMVQTAHPQVGVITNIGFGYSDPFETPERQAQEYGLLLEYLSPSGLAVLNHDDDRVRAMASRTRAQVFTVGIENYGADLTANNLVLGMTRTGFDLRYGSQRFVGRLTSLLGKHQLTNALCALGVGLHFDIQMVDALRALAELHPLPGRMNPLNGVNGALLIDDSHSADPQNTQAALEWLQAVTESANRAVFMLGDMDGLGSFSQRGHRLVGQRAAEFVSLLVTEGSDASLAARAALDQGLSAQNVHVTYSLEDSVAKLRDQLTPNDVVLIKGGAGARLELITRELLADPKEAEQLARRSLLSQSEALLRPARPSWVEIDLDALAQNVRAIKKTIGDEVTLFATVKANAYGHGAVACARTALLNGADYLAVANIHEALELRDAGIEAPILIMSYVPVQQIRQAVRQNLTVTLYDLELARAYDRAAREAGGKLKAHIEIDTGMGRLGVLATEAIAFFRSLMNMNHVQVEGVFTHFSAADEDETYTEDQARLFRGVMMPLRAAGFSFQYVHSANSAGILRSSAYHFNAVRAGVALYGLSPSPQMPMPEAFRPVMTWKSVVAQVKTLPPGHNIGYGNTYRTRAAERIAVIPVGYADGFRRAPHQNGRVLIHGVAAPIVGRISMEKTVVSVDAIPDVAIGDEVVLIGRQADARISAEEVAAAWGTINYEVTCLALARQPRR